MTDEVRQNLDKRCTTSASPEQLAYLDWYRGGESEYPYYDEDEHGHVLHPGHSHETSWEAMVERIRRTEDDGGDMDVAGESVVQRGNVPSPGDALAMYRDFVGTDSNGVTKGIESLSSRERDVFVLTHVCLMWPREIAKHLGISVETVKTFLKRANRKLSSLYPENT